MLSIRSTTRDPGQREAVHLDRLVIGEPSTEVYDRLVAELP